MARPIRFQAAGLIYHVMSRGNNKMVIFLDDLDFAQFLALLAEVVAIFELDSWLVCVMPNHYHLVFRTRKPNLSRAIQRLNGRYARWWNTRHGHVGHILQGRFKGQIVEASVYLVRLCRYVLLNPVRWGLCQHPSGWPWSSYTTLVSGEPSPYADVGSLLPLVDADPASARARLTHYVQPETDPDIQAFIRNDHRIIGTPAFAAQFRLQARAASKEVPLRERRIGAPSLVDILAAAVKDGDGLAAGVRRARAVGRYSYADIARCAGVSESTVARMVIGRTKPVNRTPAGRIADLTLGVDGPQT
jgi:putative transposase